MSGDLHQSANRWDQDGWLVPTCTCGWSFGPVPDDETGIDVLMDHALEMGQLIARGVG